MGGEHCVLSTGLSAGIAGRCIARPTRAVLLVLFSLSVSGRGVLPDEWIIGTDSRCLEHFFRFFSHPTKAVDSAGQCDYLRVRVRQGVG